jgi:hypothetical protein
MGIGEWEPRRCVVSSEAAYNAPARSTRVAVGQLMLWAASTISLSTSPGWEIKLS